MRSTIILLIVMALACETREHANDELGALKKAQAAADKASAHARGPEEEIGIAECDEYIRKYEACLEKVPGEAEARFRNSLDAQRKQWRAASKDPFARDGIADQCRSAMATAKQSMSAYGCEF
jgi:hypothetical protein